MSALNYTWRPAVSMHPARCTGQIHATLNLVSVRRSEALFLPRTPSPMTTRRKFPLSARTVCVVLVFFLAPSFMLAQSGPPGVVVGRVQDRAAGLYLENARVTVEGTAEAHAGNEAA